MADLIDQIGAIRTRNNGYWMELLRLALEVDPERAKAILRQIQECDTEVTRLARKLAET